MLFRSVPEEDEEESSSDEDVEYREGSDGEVLGTRKETPVEVEFEVREKGEDASGFH